MLTAQTGLALPLLIVPVVVDLPVSSPGLLALNGLLLSLV